MVNSEKAPEPNRQTIGESTPPKKALSPDTLRKMIASGKSVPSIASAQ